MNIAIIDYGAGNTQSVIFALNRLGIEPVLTADHQELLSADKIILPGVGHAQSAMQNLKSKQLDVLIRQLKQPVLGICLGMQLMCDFSEEGDTECLGLIPTTIRKFPPLGKVPHMGWNEVLHENASLFEGIEKGDFFYHVHSYYAPISEYTIGTANHLIPFSSAIAKDNFCAVQFHPEKSGKAGEQLLENFIKKMAPKI